MADKDDVDAKNNIIALEGNSALQSGIIQVVGLARLSLLILTQGLDDKLYRSLELVEAIKKQALEQRRLRVKILVSNPKNALREAEAFINLTRRLSSQFEIREPISPEYAFQDECVVADRLAYVYRSRPENLISSLALDHPLGALGYRKEFDERWLNSTPCAELRQLHY